MRTTAAHLTKTTNASPRMVNSQRREMREKARVTITAREEKRRPMSN